LKRSSTPTPCAGTRPVGAARPRRRPHKTEHEAFTKRDFIALYISEHARQTANHPGLTPPPAAGTHVASWRSADPRAFLTGIEAKLLDGIAYADSYLAQRIRLPRAPEADRDVILIGLDTNQAGPLVSTWDTLMGRSPGSTGHITPTRSRPSPTGSMKPSPGATWSSSPAITTGAPSACRPASCCAPDAPPRPPLVYLSAHTHRGFWAEHRTLAHRPLLEMNVSSCRTGPWPTAASASPMTTRPGLRVKADLLPAAPSPMPPTPTFCPPGKHRPAAHRAFRCDIRDEDMALVQQQRSARGTLVEWLVQYLAPVCEG
jgi:hypothetical protein